MHSKVFYFSGTGNSMSVARDIAEGINGELISIPSIMGNEKIFSDAERIVIVFPMYHHGIPYIIKRFVDKLENLEGKYISGVCTYGDNPGISLEHLDKAVKEKNGRLSAGFAVKMPYNYMYPTFAMKDFFNSFTLREIDEEDKLKMFGAWKERCEDICRLILSENKRKLETKAGAIEHLADFLNLRESLQKSAWLKVSGFRGKSRLPFIESIQLMDHGFSCDNKCTACGICEKACPVNNIKIIEKRPVWHHRCEQCFACLHWCPEEAVQFGHGTHGKKRYHNPQVSLADMINTKK